MATASVWAETYENLKQKHDEAYFVIDEAIKLESEGKHREAYGKYEAGLYLIDSALAMSQECLSDPDVTWEKAHVMVQKMAKTKQEVLSRLADLQSSPEPPQRPPPSYEEAVSAPAARPVPHTYKELGDALQELRVETDASTAQVLFVLEGVRLYFISPDGTVTSTSRPDTLRIVQLQDVGENMPRGYLQVGSWIYPLVPEVSPCLVSEFGAFVFPDLQSDVEGAAVGITLPEEADESVHELLDDILHGVASSSVGGKVVQRRTPRWKRSVSTSSTISQRIVQGAGYIAQGLVWGAQRVGDLINYGTPKIMERLTPASQPTSLDPRVSHGLQVAKDVTGTVVNVTGQMACALGSATMSLGRFLAPHVQRQGARLLSHTLSMSEEESSRRVEGVLEVAAGAVEGLSTVYDGLERSAGILGSNLANNTVRIVAHKYGHPAADATGDTLYTVGNIYAASRNVRIFTPKGLMKTTAKSAGKAVVEDYRPSLPDRQDGASTSSKLN
ncbi:protein spartin [Bacillus rossius redtenbacheri]|uniref:protein spartin n=1 Tax=Bacillus rossius redtenbacheri TaxID=93214 RepID=UPI002FDDB26E